MISPALSFPGSLRRRCPDDGARDHCNNPTDNHGFAKIYAGVLARVLVAVSWPSSGARAASPWRACDRA
eukprot:4563817-Alexandrium_andersonii.AAC.1